MDHRADTVVILGGGINGCALARELVLNGLSVYLVDAADLSAGATSGSSRLIHGGLRYLEYGDFELVKESLAERTRLLRLAPQLVRPLELWIPAATRAGGAIGTLARFFGWRWPTPVPRQGRGVWLIRAGLKAYDLYAQDPLLPRHRVVPVTSPDGPPVDRGRYHWLCSYYDGQVPFPERLVVSMLEDARQLADQQGLEFRVLTQHQASLRGRTVEIRARAGADAWTLEPAAVVNATGAWVDETLARLHVPSRRLMGGTKGSHLFTFSPHLREMLHGRGIYAEAADGRPVFITPLADVVLIGTTDEPFEGPPEQAVASAREIEYLLTTVNAILPEARLTAGDVAFHYSAVRPLPFSDATTPAAISRRHAIVRNPAAALPLFSLVGGKLTTMRSLAESTTEAVLAALSREVIGNSRDRVFPGSEDYPADEAAKDARIARLAERSGLPKAAVAATWQLVGTRAEAVLATSDTREGGQLLPGVSLPATMARWAIRHEWAAGLGDLVERRLMLLYDPGLCRQTLVRLAELLAAEGRLPQAQIEAAAADEVERLAMHFGRRI